MSKNLRALASKVGIENNLFNKMGELAQDSGSLSDEKLKELADEFLIGNATTFGVTTFYDFLKPDNQGKKAYI